MSLSQILREYRKSHDLTQLELAATLSVDKRTIRRWENQETRVTDVRELRRIASVLGVEAERLGVTNQVRGITSDQADEILQHVWQLVTAARFFEARALAERLVADLQINARCSGSQGDLYRLTQAHRATAYVQGLNSRNSEIWTPLASYCAMEQMARLLNDPTLLTLALAFKGKMYNRLGEVNKGNQYLEMAVALAPEEDSTGKGTVALLLADGCFKASQRGAFERWMAEAEQRAEQVTGEGATGEPFGLRAVYAAYGKSYALLGNLHQALAYIQQAQHVSPVNPFWDLVLKTITVMALIRGGEIHRGVNVAIECIEQCRELGAFEWLERMYSMEQYLLRLIKSIGQSAAMLSEALNGPTEYYRYGGEYLELQA